MMKYFRDLGLTEDVACVLLFLVFIGTMAALAETF